MNNEMSLSEAITHFKRWLCTLEKTKRRTRHMEAVRAILRHFGELQ
jgi:hypothetical protein